MSPLKTRLSRFLPHFAFLLPAAMLAVLLGGRPIAPDNDVYLHLNEGRRIVETGQLPWTDVYSYTAAGTPNECLHSWLSQWAMWKVFSAGGETGLKMLAFLLLLVPLALGWRYVWRATRSPGWAVLFGSLFVLLQSRIVVIRPLLFGEALFAVVALGILPGTSKLSPGRVAALAFIAALWANLHGSVVVMAVIMGCYVTAHVWTRWKASDMLTVAASPWIVLSASLSPLGPSIFGTAAAVSSTGGATVGNEEWSSVIPVRWHDFYPPPSYFSIALDGVSILVMLSIVVTAWGLAHAIRNEERRFPALLSAACVALTMLSYRHALYLVFPVAVVTAALGASAARFRLRPFFREVIVGYAGLALLFYLRFHVSPDIAPGIARAADFLEAARIEGNVANPPSWGNYLAYRLHPRVKVSSDSRTVVHRAFYQLERALYERYGERSMHLLLGSLPPDTMLVALPMFAIPPAAMLPPTHWALVFENNTVSILMKRDKANEENFRRVTEYYASQKIPFDAKAGFSSAGALTASPGWFIRHYEHAPWGTWPSQPQRDEWARRETVYFKSRKLAGASLGEDIHR